MSRARLCYRNNRQLTPRRRMWKCLAKRQMLGCMCAVASGVHVATNARAAAGSAVQCQYRQRAAERQRSASTLTALHGIPLPQRHDSLEPQLALRMPARADPLPLVGHDRITCELQDCRRACRRSQCPRADSRGRAFGRRPGLSCSTGCRMRRITFVNVDSLLCGWELSVGTTSRGSFRHSFR